jgi:V/A-type H+-transporting ATPase subunit C
VSRLDYANARVGARRARLLGPGTFRELLAHPTLEGRLAMLRDTAAGAALPGVAAAAPGGEAASLGPVEAGLREALAREELRILADAEGGRARALLAAVLGIEEATSVKAIVRGVAHGATVERILAAALPAPGLGPERLREAAASTSVERALAALAAGGSEVAVAAQVALALRAKHGLLPLELAADRAAFARAAAAARGPGEDAAIVRAHLEDRVDARNAATLLALAGAAPGADAFVAGGRRLPEPAFRALAGAPPPELRAGLAARFRGEAAGLASPWSADRALERAVLGPLRRAARTHPLSVAVPLAYLLERRAEVRRVALVLRGTAIGVPGEELVELVEA